MKEFDFEVVYMGKLGLVNISKSFYVSVKIVFEKQFQAAAIVALHDLL